jgi:AraC-like DNA-binding protein
MGRLSNPVLHRLTEAEIEGLIQQYRDGDSIDTLSHRYKVHRTTVMHHLAHGGIARRRMIRKLTERSVALAATQYEAGASLTVVASAFGVHARTLAREFRRAGVLIRPRRGWPPDHRSER